MEDFSVDFTIDQGPHARVVPLQLAPFTLVGATTREGLLSAPFRSRFGIAERLVPYPVEDLVRILARSAAILGIELAPDGARLIAERARGTPRIANRFLRRVRDFAQVGGVRAVGEQLAGDTLARLGVDRHGLEELDRRILSVMAQNPELPVGLKTIAAAVGESEDTIEEVFEPHLLRCGFLQKTARGRQVTPRGLAAIGIDPRTAGAQAGLFA
jgi:Holliday junction DNA helicase RuvB